MWLEPKGIGGGGVQGWHGEQGKRTNIWRELGARFEKHMQME